MKTLFTQTKLFILKIYFKIVSFLVDITKNSKLIKHKLAVGVLIVGMMGVLASCNNVNNKKQNASQNTKNENSKDTNIIMDNSKDSIKIMCYEEGPPESRKNKTEQDTIKK